MDDGNKKLVEIGVLLCYAADALKGDARLKKAVYHLDRAAGVIADLLPEPPRQQPVEVPPSMPESAPLERTEIPVRKKCGRKPILICPRCKTAPKAEGKPYCSECFRTVMRDYQRRKRAKIHADADAAPPLPPPPDTGTANGEVGTDRSGTGKTDKAGMLPRSV